MSNNQFLSDLLRFLGDQNSWVLLLVELLVQQVKQGIVNMESSESKKYYLHVFLFLKTDLRIWNKYENDLRATIQYFCIFAAFVVQEIVCLMDCFFSTAVQTMWKVTVFDTSVFKYFQPKKAWGGVESQSIKISRIHIMALMKINRLTCLISRLL